MDGLTDQNVLFRGLCLSKVNETWPKEGGSLKAVVELLNVLYTVWALPYPWISRAFSGLLQLFLMMDFHFKSAYLSGLATSNILKVSLLKIPFHKSNVQYSQV